MAYKIAVASSDQIRIDLNFGAAVEFLIYEVRDNGEYNFLEIRNASPKIKEDRADLSCETGCNSVYNSSCERDSSCERNSSCGESQSSNPKVLLIADCRCVICKKVGLHIQKELEKKAITTFDVDGRIEDTLNKITSYFYRIDHHQTLRGIANQI